MKGRGIDNVVEFNHSSPLPQPSPVRDCVVMRKTSSFPQNLSLHALSRERESSSFKLLRSTTEWMAALHHTRYRARLRGHDEL
jgi:hypothetical protein